mmetsp:Transcript_82393/g.148665  ORF Transcript_82393/g.148665 Transcript_82393/m.148665 type:complete len:529 (-) Transcript_82393:1212-2798(-)
MEHLGFLNSERASNLLAQEIPGWDHRVRVQRQGIDALIHQPLGQVWVVRRTLAADANVLALLLGSLDQDLQALHHCWIPLIEVLGHQARVTVQAEGQLSQIVAANREAVEVLQKLFGQENIAWQLCHHVHLQSVLASLQAILGQQVHDILGHVQGAHEWNHELHVGHAHLPTNLLHGLQFHGEAFLEGGISVSAAASEANHGVLLIRLVLVSADQALVLVGLEVRQTHDDALRVDRAGQSGDTLGDLVDVEFLWAGIALHAHIDFRLGLSIKGRVVQKGLRMHADGVVDHKLQAGQADTVVGQLTEAEGRLRVSHVHHDLQADLRKIAKILGGPLELQRALVDEASVTLGARDRHLIALRQLFCGVATANHGRNAQLASNDCRVASAATTIGNDGTGLLHDGLPVRICHVCDQHISLLELRHLVNAGQEVDLARADTLADGTAFNEDVGALLLHLVLLKDSHLLLGGHGLRAGLHDVDLAIIAITSPLDVHGAAIMLLDLHRHGGKVFDLLVRGRIPVLILWGGIDGL